jgi:hypothetical protein
VSESLVVLSPAHQPEKSTAVLSDRQALFSLHLRWLIGTAVATVVAVGVYIYAIQVRSGERWPGGSSHVGLGMGIIAAAIIFFECALVLRRVRLKRFRMFRAWGSAQFWMKAHIWLGLLAIPLVLMHSGFHWGGWLSTLLAGCFALVSASGVFGLVMQTILPRKMLDLLPEETIHLQIDVVARQMAADARRLVGLIDVGEQDAAVLEMPVSKTLREAKSAGLMVTGYPRNVGTMVERVPRPERERPEEVATPPELQSAVKNVIQHFLLTGKSPEHGLHLPQRSSWYFEELRRRVESREAQPSVTTLERFCERRRQMNLQRTLHFWLHAWLHVHVPLAAILLALLIGHIWFAWQYS